MSLDEVQRIAAELLAPSDARRIQRVSAAAAYAADRLLVDGHLSRHEERALPGAMTGRGDFTTEEAEVILRLLREHGGVVSATRATDWAYVLGPWLVAPRSLSQESDYIGMVAGSLAVRWPLPIDDAYGQRWKAGDIDWSPEVIRIGPSSALSSMTIRWRDVYSLEPIDPWPDVLVEYTGVGANISHVRLSPKGDREAFEERVMALVEEAKARVPAAEERVRLGWMELPDVEWERVPYWPGEEPLPAAGYRTAPQRPEEVLAHRPPKGGLRVMLEWLVSTQGVPFKRHIVEARATARHLYIRRRDGTLARIPIGTLRTRRGDIDAVYVFGRRATALLTDRLDCPVAAHLDALLGRVSPSR